MSTMVLMGSAWHASDLIVNTGGCPGNTGESGEWPRGWLIGQQLGHHSALPFPAGSSAGTPEKHRWACTQTLLAMPYEFSWGIAVAA